MISEQELNEALNRARGLMNSEGDAKINQAAKRNSSNFKMNESGEFTFTQPHNSKGMGAMKQTTRTGTPSANLPKAIRESMMNNPIDSSGMMLESNNNVSVLDSLNMSQPQRQTVNEAMVYEQQYSAPQQPVYYQPQYVPQSAPMTIDYNYIRAIVNECVQANLEKIKEEILSESNLKLVRLNNGNKIQLVDNKNNLYESTLTFKKNLNKA